MYEKGDEGAGGDVWRGAGGGGAGEGGIDKKRGLI